MCWSAKILLIRYRQDVMKGRENCFEATCHSSIKQALKHAEKDPYQALT